jgi:hypothetical protein
MAGLAQASNGGQDDAAPRWGDLARFRQEFYTSLTGRADALFELTDAVLCADGPVQTVVDLTLVAEHRRGHGAMYDALGHGRVEPERIRRALACALLPRAADGRIVLAVDVSPWLRSDAPTSADRLFCHVYGRGKGQAQLIPGWPYSFDAALEPGRTSWTALLDAVRLGPTDDATAVTADQLRAVIARLTAAGHWHDGDPDILIVTDAGYDITRLAFVLADLPAGLLGRIRSGRVLRLPKPPRLPGTTGRPPKHGPEFTLDKPASWPEPQQTTITETTRYGTATATSWDRLHPRLTHVAAKSITMASCPSSRAPSSGSGSGSSTCPVTATPSRSGCGPRPPAPAPQTLIGGGSRFCADSTSSTPSGCSSRPWAGPSRRSAAQRPLIAGLARDRRTHPTPPRPTIGARPPPALGETRRLTPARVRRGFSEPPRDNHPAGQRAQTHRPGPGRPPGSKNGRSAPHYDVGKTAKRDLTVTARQQR